MLTESNLTQVMTNLYSVLGTQLDIHACHLCQKNQRHPMPQRQAIHRMGHHGAITLSQVGIQKYPSGVGRFWHRADQSLQTVLSNLKERNKSMNFEFIDVGRSH